MSDCSREGLILSGERRVMVPRRVPLAALATIFTFEFEPGIYDNDDELPRGDGGDTGLLVDVVLMAPPLLILLKP